MKKGVYIFVIIAITICLFACEDNQTISLGQVVLLTKPYKNDSIVLTKYDAAVWLAKLVKYLEGDELVLNASSDTEKNELFDEAVQRDIIQDSNDINSAMEQTVTREEAFAMINRAFMIGPNVNMSLLYNYPDAGDVQRWSMQTTANIVNIIANSNSAYLLEFGIFPQSPISQEDMINMVDPTIQSDFNHVNDPDTGDVIKQISKKILALYIFLGGTVFWAISMFFRFVTYQYKKNRIKKEIIYIGYVSCGKTELSTALPDPHRPRRDIDYTPTRGVRTVQSVKIRNNNGEDIFWGLAKDSPGGSNDALLDFLRDNPFRRKIIILILAHNQKKNSSEIDDEYIKEQYNRIDQVYLPAIRHYPENIYKLIVFINKCDTLPSSYQPNKWGDTQETIYKTHFNLLHKGLPHGIIFQVVTGSATKRTNIEELRKLLE